MTVYVNWEEREILSAEELEEKAQELGKEIEERTTAREEYLSHEVDVDCLMKALQGDKEMADSILNDFSDYCCEQAHDELEDTYEEYEFED